MLRGRLRLCREGEHEQARHDRRAMLAHRNEPSFAGERAPVIRGKAPAALDTRATHDPPPGEEAICGSPWDKTPAAQEFPPSL
jgi:hypothetical protein